MSVGQRILPATRCGVGGASGPSTSWTISIASCWRLKVDFNLPAARVVRTLEWIAAVRGYPLKLRLDNGPEFISVTLADWAEQHGVLLEFIKPGKPMQNGFIERFNRSYREAVLDMFVFQSLSEVREETEKWLKEYNEERPHESLGHMTPREYLLTPRPEISTNDRT